MTSLKECKSVASNTGKIIDIDQEERKMLEFFVEVQEDSLRKCRQ